MYLLNFQIFPGKFTIGINDSKEMCYLNLTNPVYQDLVFEALEIAEKKCLERINWIRELVAEDDKERSIPCYMRHDEPRKDGRVIQLSSLDETEADIQKLSLLDSISDSVSNGSVPSEIIVKWK